MLNTCIIIFLFGVIIILTIGKNHILLNTSEFTPPQLLTNRVATNCFRGAAILMILVGHISGNMHTVYFTPIGGTGVAIFLFLSGFGLNESYKKTGLTNFWSKKVVRVLMPYAIVITALWFYWDYKFDWLYVLNLLGLKTYYWYVAFLIKWYIAFYVLTRFAYRWRIYGMMAIAIVMLIFFPNIEAEQAFSFLLGVIVSVKINKVHSMSSRSLCIVALLCAVIGITCLGIKQMDALRHYSVDYIMNIIQCGIKLPLAIALMAGLTFIPLVFNSLFMKWVGLISYELYLVHFPFYPKLNGSLSQAFLFILISFIAAYALYLVDNALSKRLLRNVKRA